MAALGVYVVAPRVDVRDALAEGLAALAQALLLLPCELCAAYSVAMLHQYSTS